MSVEYVTPEPVKIVTPDTPEINALIALGNRVRHLEIQNNILREAVVNLESKVEEFDQLIAKVNEGMEAAKANPMVRNLLKGLGL